MRPPLGGNPLEFGDEIWLQKTRILGLPDGAEMMTLAFFVLAQYWHVTDGRTDRQTDGHVAIAITRASIAYVLFSKDRPIHFLCYTFIRVLDILEI